MSVIKTMGSGNHTLYDTEAREKLDEMFTATADDIGKALVVESVSDGVASFTFGDADTTELTKEVEVIASATVTETLNYLDLTLASTETYKTVSATGDVTDGTLANQKIYVYSIPDTATNVVIDAIGRVGNENNYAIYSATTFATCSATTALETGTYTSLTAKTVAVPEGAKMLLIGAKSLNSDTQYTTVTVSSKADTNMADAYNTSVVYFVGDYCSYGGAVYKRTSYTGTTGAWDATEWEQVALADEIKDVLDETALTQTFDSSLFQVGKCNSYGEVVSSTTYIVTTDIQHNDDTIVINIADGYVCTIYYYDSAGTLLSNNGGSTDLQYRTILPDSYFRVVIRSSSSDTITTAEIPAYVSRVTFDTDYAKTLDAIEENSENGLEALCAKMFERGGSPTEFSLAPCILVAGQSNINGRVPIADLPSDITFPFEYIKVGNDNGGFSSSETAPSYWDITTSMFSALNALGTDIYKIKHSSGGTSISEYGDSSYHWTPFYENISGGISKALLYTFDSKIKKCMSVTPNTFNVRAFIWQQGEGDRSATSKQASLNYYKNFKCLIAYVRGIAGDEKLPVICGTVSHRSGQYDPVVEEATLKVAEEDPYVTCIDMSGGTLLDSFHFDADSAVYFGQMAFDALVDFGVISADKLEPTCPWTVYTVTSTLTNCTLSNDDTTAISDMSYATKITADGGYTLNSVTVTMGGTDVTSTYYANGLLSIGAVTGNIVITASATATS